MQNLLTLVVLSSAVAALAMLAKSNLVHPLLSAALMFALAVLPFFAWDIIKFVV
jgi:hypothetical protein